MGKDTVLMQGDQQQLEEGSNRSSCVYFMGIKLAPNVLLLGFHLSPLCGNLIKRFIGLQMCHYLLGESGLQLRSL